MFNKTVSSRTDVGRKRSHNEDHLIFDEELGLYIVCDGMGGHAAGEVASLSVCQSLLEFFRKQEDTLKELDHHKEKIKSLKELVKEAILFANLQLFSIAEEDPSKKGMGTTLVMALMRGRDVIIAHVGDSRAYLKRGDQLHQITEDHSLVNQMIKNGIVKKEDAANHPQGNVITRAMGIHQLVSPDVISLELMVNDRLLMCSDGLYEYYDQEQLYQALCEANELDKINQKLIESANERGGKDNISSLLIQLNSFEEQEEELYENVEKKIQTLKRIPLFTSMNYKELAKILEIIQLENYESGKDIVIEHQPGGDMFVILKGKADVLCDEVKISELPAGGYFGEMSLIDMNPRSATVRATEDMRLMRIPRDSLLNLLKEEPKVGVKLFWAFLHNMNHRLRESDKRILEFQKKLNAIEDIEGAEPLALSLDF